MSSTLVVRRNAAHDMRWATLRRDGSVPLPRASPSTRVITFYRVYPLYRGRSSPLTGTPPALVPQAPGESTLG